MVRLLNAIRSQHLCRFVSASLDNVVSTQRPLHTLKILYPSFDSNGRWYENTQTMHNSSRVKVKTVATSDGRIRLPMMELQNTEDLYWIFSSTLTSLVGLDGRHRVHPQELCIL